MPTRPARPTRTARTSTARRTPARRSSAAKRRGVAGGWLQRRRPEPSRKSKATAAAKRALPGGKGVAAAALALAGAVGVALRKRGGDDHAHTPATPPVTSTPSPTATPTKPADVPPAA